MGFSCMCHPLVLPKPLAQLLQIICHIGFAIAAVLSCVGLQPPEIFLDLADRVNHRSSPDLLTAPVNPAAAVKSELPVVEFASLFSRSRWVSKLCASEEHKCIVCLGWLEAKDEVRELGNCCHAFHKECIDRWVDIGHVTCPLCRSLMLSSQRKEMISWIQTVKFWRNIGAIKFWNLG